MMLTLIMPVIGPIVSSLVIAAILWFFKLPQAIKENTKAIQDLTLIVQRLSSDVELTHLRLDENERRHDITQQIISDIIDENIDTRSISKEFSKYPTLQNFRARFRRES